MWCLVTRWIFFLFKFFDFQFYNKWTKTDISNLYCYDCDYLNGLLQLSLILLRISCSLIKTIFMYTCVCKKIMVTGCINTLMVSEGKMHYITNVLMLSYFFRVFSVFMWFSSWASLGEMDQRQKTWGFR